MKKRRNKKRFKGGGFKGILIAALIFLVSVFVLEQLTTYLSTNKEISYSSFLKHVERDNIKSVKVSGQDVQGIFKDGTHFETVLGNTPTNWEMFKQHNVEVAVESPSNSMGLWYLFPFGSLLLTLLLAWYFLKQTRGGSGGSGGAGSGLFNMGKSRAKMFMPKTIKETFDSVAGAAEAKEELQDVVDFLKNPDKYKKLGARITNGVLLIGEPGNGKTLLARAVAGEANCPFFSISGSDFIEVFVGVGASRVRDLFAQARKHAPSIIFIDEIDAVGRHRGSGLGGGHDEREQTLNQLLTEMDGFQTAEQDVVVIAATNRPDVLDSALLRPGRFDRRVNVPFPDQESRLQILKVHAKKVKLDSEVNLKRIARGTPGFSGADLENLINEAAIMASKAGQKTITMDDFEEARDKKMVGKKRQTMQQTSEDLELTAYHEAGHTLVRMLSPEKIDPVHKVTILPRGGALGITWYLPEREKYSKTKSEYLATITSALGGRAAEEIVYKDFTSGASSDYQTATEIARNMVCLWGMSDKVGMVNMNYDHSEGMAHVIDQEVRRIIDECYAKAKEILTENRDKLDLLAKTLLDKETMFAKEVYELLGLEPRKDHSFLGEKDDEMSDDEESETPVASEPASVEQK